MQKKLIFLVCVLFILFQSCATKNNNTVSESVIIISNGVNPTLSDDLFRLFIDGQEVKMKRGETKTFNVSNGYHSLTFQTKTNNIWYDWEDVGSINFELNNERIELRVTGSGGIQEANRIALSRSSLSQVSIATKNAVITTSFEKIYPYIPNDSNIAIMDIYPNDNDSVFIREELTVLFVNSRKYIIVDRQTLETVRQEQRFQMSGEVSDESAVSIGQFLGADVVITGNISGENDQKRLRFRVLDVKTGQLLAMTSEEI